jgi:hypothetical protein
VASARALYWESTVLGVPNLKTMTKQEIAANACTASSLLGLAIDSHKLEFLGALFASVLFYCFILWIDRSRHNDIEALEKKISEINERVNTVVLGGRMR